MPSNSAATRRRGEDSGQTRSYLSRSGSGMYAMSVCLSVLNAEICNALHSSISLAPEIHSRMELRYFRRRPFIPLACKVRRWMIVSPGMASVRCCTCQCNASDLCVLTYVQHPSVTARVCVICWPEVHISHTGQSQRPGPWCSGATSTTLLRRTEMDPGAMYLLLHPCPRFAAMPCAPGSGGRGTPKCYTRQDVISDRIAQIYPETPFTYLTYS